MSIQNNILFLLFVSLLNKVTKHDKEINAMHVPIYKKAIHNMRVMQDRKVKYFCYKIYFSIFNRL